MKLKFDPYQFKITNVGGVSVYWKDIPWANGFAYIRILVGTGARHDPIGREGTAHFFEHVPFNGCKNYPTREIIEGINRTLFHKNLNAETSFERTVFSGKVRTEKMRPAMRFLGNFIGSPVLDSANIDRERKVIIREIWRTYNNKRIVDLMRWERSLSYGTHSFNRQELAFGWHDTVEKITRDDLRSFHSKYYGRRNMKIIIVGDVTRFEVQEVETFLKAIPEGGEIVPVDKIERWQNPQRKVLSVSISKFLGLKGESIPQEAHVKVFRPMPLQANSQTLFLATRLVSQVLSDRIRGKLGATYSPSVWKSEFRDHCHMGISVGVDPTTIGAVRHIISDTIHEISSGTHIYQKLFQELKAAGLEHKLFHDDSAEGIADAATRELGNTGGLITLAEDYKDMKKVTYNDVAELFARELAPEQLFWYVARP